MGRRSDSHGRRSVTVRLADARPGDIVRGDTDILVVSVTPLDAESVAVEGRVSQGLLPRGRRDARCQSFTPEADVWIEPAGRLVGLRARIVRA